MREEQQKIALEVRSHLFGMQDLEYKEFQCRLIPTIDPNTVIGVRTPELRKFAKEYAKTPEAAEYLKILPHEYYDENNLHGFLIEAIRDYDACVGAIDAFLPYVDNWATCDLMSPKVLGRHLPRLLEQIQSWMNSEATYTIRFGIELLMRFYLDDDFRPEYLERVAVIRSEEYYVNMMIAWFFATALAKQYEATLPYIEQNRLAPDTHNKAIQKAAESYRITPEQKQYLKKWKIRTK